jgi:uncharacterized membrane protein YhaH (DUF805 family)
MNLDKLMQFIPYLIPVLIIQLALIVIALIDLVKREHTRGPKWLWAIIIILVNFIGPIVYFVVGRKEE